MNIGDFYSEHTMDDIWWGQITKATNFVHATASTVLDHNSIVISLPERTPWKETLYDNIEGILREGDPEYKLDLHDCPEEEPGEFLLEEYCKRDKRNSYRFGMSYAKFLAESEDIVLNSRYVWIRSVSGEKLKKWLHFITEYNKNLRKNASAAVFILETQDESIKGKKPKGLRYLSFDESIDFYDKYTFCVLASTGVDIRPSIRPYVAEMVSSVCKDDIELCAICMQEWNDFVKEPLKTLLQVTSSEMHSDGTPFSADYDAEIVEARVWEAQIKLLFPIVERYRTRFVKKHRQYIENALPIETIYGEMIDDPLDVELGALCRLVRDNTIPLSTREDEQLDTFKRVRNNLAHLKTLDFELVEWVLSQRI